MTIEALCTCNHGDHIIALCPLHAAAPLLLTALEQTVKQFEAEIHNEYDGTSMLEDRLAEVDHARAAIARARERRTP